MQREAPTWTKVVEKMKLTDGYEMETCSRDAVKKIYFVGLLYKAIVLGYHIRLHY